MPEKSGHRIASLTLDPPRSQLSPSAPRHHHALFFFFLTKTAGGIAAYASSPAQPDMSDYELMNVVTVGGNPISAFLSWRLQATNACDVTLVWKTGFEHVSQYGISFKYALSPPRPGPFSLFFLEVFCANYFALQII